MTRHDPTLTTDEVEIVKKIVNHHDRWDIPYGVDTGKVGARLVDTYHGGTYLTPAMTKEIEVNGFRVQEVKVLSPEDDLCQEHGYRPGWLTMLIVPERNFNVGHLDVNRY